MPEKFFDILPPQFSKGLEPKRLPKRLPEDPPPRRKIGLILIFGILIIIGVFAYFSLSRAKIEIWPETQILNFKEKIEINTQKKQPDFSAKIFPGKIFEVELDTSQEFSSAGKTLKTEKAHGKIQLYNAYSDSPQTLIANTRFISAEGKLFRSVEKVTIPGGKYNEKGKLVPGVLEIEVVAAEAGEEYNIGPSTFSIPGFAGTSKYTAFYGKSFGPMTGGFKGEALQVTQADLDGAKNALTKKLFEEGITALKNKIPSGFVLLDEAINQEITELIPSAQVGAETQVFNLRAKVRLKVLSFKESDLENFVKGFIVTQMPQEALPEDGFWLNKKIQDESLKLDYEFSSIDWQTEKIILNLAITAKIYPDINEAALKKALSGKSLKETQLILAGHPQIKKLDVKFWPFWVQNIPQAEKKIEIKLNLGD